MNYYKEIKNRLIENENYARIKEYSKERYKLNTYYEIGKILSEAGKCYGENIIGKYADRLQKEVGKKYNKSTLFKMKKLYMLCSNLKVTPLVPQLTWSHWLQLIPIKDSYEINYYIEQVSKRCLSKRELQEIIKNPVIIHNKNNKIVVTERDLQNIILENISSFLKELGNKFCFIDSEYKIKIGDSYNYIDLLLYNSEFHCYVVVELKITELRKEYIGQIETYMNYVDKNIKDMIDNLTIGIIICKRDNHFIMEYCSDKRILSRYYKVL